MQIRYFPTILCLSVIARKYSSVRDECTTRSISFLCELVNKGAYALEAPQLEWPCIHFCTRCAACSYLLKDGLMSFSSRQSSGTRYDCIYLHFRACSHLARSLLVARSSLGCIFTRCTEASNPSPTFDPVTRKVFELTSSTALGRGRVRRCSRKYRRRVNTAIDGIVKRDLETNKKQG